MGILGIELPLSERAALFIEGRISADLLLIELDNALGDDDVEIENLGGTSALTGLLVYF